MKRSARIFCFSISLFLAPVVFLCACHKSEGAQALAERAAAVPCFSSDVEKSLADAGERLDSLSKNESGNADKALVMLLGYYLGEHNAEELVSEIVRRGKRMVPLLVQERQVPAVLSTCAPRSEVETVKMLCNDAIKAIAQGGIGR